MPITLACSTCGCALEVPEEYAGKQARCPRCQQVNRVPEVSDPPPSALSDQASFSAPPAVTRTWMLKTPEGQQYGPVAEDELQRWVGEGRIANDCQLRATGGVWQPADQVFPSLRPHPSLSEPARPGAAPAGLSPSARPGLGLPPSGGGHHRTNIDSASARSPGATATGGGQPFLLPDRGALILCLAILGWFVCPILSISAWVMGSNDLAEMRAGRMDRNGEGLTQAGRILGMVHGISLIVGMVVAMFGMLIVFGMLGR